MNISRTTGIIMLLCTVFLSGSAAYAQQQELFGGKVKVSGMAVSRSGDNVFIAMDIDVSGLGLRTDREVVLTPYVAGKNDTLSLVPVTIAGRNRYFTALREGHSPEERNLYRDGKVKVIEYRTVAPWALWMAGASLSASGQMRGCCGTGIASEDSHLAYMENEPRRFVPEFVYMRPAGEAVKMRSESGAAYVDFPVNRTEIHENYRNNAHELSKIMATVDLVKNDADTRIISLSIKGYASPEGPYDNNVRLAKGRTQALKEYVRRHYDFPDSLMVTSFEPEDWDGLESYVRNSQLLNREGIIKIISMPLKPDAKEWKLKSTYPDDYAFLLREIYPALRHSDYEVKYEVRSYTDVEEIIRLLKTRPQKLDLNEMYLAAQTMEPGSAEYNEVFEIAVRMFPDDAAANLNAANTAMGLGNMERASAYLAKAGDSAEAVYARGLYKALAGDYDSARILFARAEELGMPEAAAASAQIGEIIK